ncbi:hypothetical protein EVAR_57885_1 [Eumeta japonica]|uniref:Uncharacterized protein n=1 Tax=Eumeta variegata TaxID=151549 RepID=A0A4C1YVU5_EUMVA|nr:hypothetical protein EVAR_57885_1 [Eumeta japonica]
MILFMQRKRQSYRDTLVFGVMLGLPVTYRESRLCSQSTIEKYEVAHRASPQQHGRREKVHSPPAPAPASRRYRSGSVRVYKTYEIYPTESMREIGITSKTENGTESTVGISYGGTVNESDMDTESKVRIDGQTIDRNIDTVLPNYPDRVEFSCELRRNNYNWVSAKGLRYKGQGIRIAAAKAAAALCR